VIVLIIVLLRLNYLTFTLTNTLEIGGHYAIACEELTEQALWGNL